ncbi:MAG: hypothetical protein K6B28_03325 [Lachnospiraceae bacterium]|nr:hypothetical protein [Lachnospiraceae bacterium]
MGNWGRETENSFDDMFDINRDGMLDPMEQSLKFEFLNKQMEEADEEEDELDEIILDTDMLDMMDEDERRDILEEAGFDPDDFDSDDFDSDDFDSDDFDLD